MATDPGALLLLRTGENMVSADGRLAGVLDPSLTQRGLEQAANAAALIVEAGMPVRAIFSSELTRAKVTAQIIGTALAVVPVRRDWRINERNFGVLTGRTKTSIVNEYGLTRFMQWNRSVAAAPPPMPDELYQEVSSMAPFDHLPARALGRTESMREVIVRAGGFYRSQIAPYLRHGHTVIVVAHGDSLRALCAVLNERDDPPLESFNVPPGRPIMYTFTHALTPLNRGGEHLGYAPAAPAEVPEQKRTHGTTRSASVVPSSPVSE